MDVLTGLRTSRRLVLLVGLFLAGPLSVVAATPATAGKVTGQVTDAATGEALPGASVLIQGTSIGAATDVEGRYTIVGAPSGPVVLVASYIGYEREERSVTVPNGGTVEASFALSWAGVQGEEVVITAQAAGQVAAVNEQFRSSTIGNVVSSARIRELPDNNAAESIGRLPGISIQRSGGEANRIAIRGLSPKFNTVTVNGIRLPSTDGTDRAVDLSLVSSNILDGVEVRKAITPDMDADVVGGNVDLRLRNAPAGLLFDVLVQGGYTGLQEELGNYKVVGTVSNRFLDERLGVIGTFNADRYDRSADKLGIGYADATVPGTDSIGVRIDNLNPREEIVDRSRVGGSILLDYRIPEGRITGNTFYNQLSNDALYRYFSPTFNNITYNVEDRSGETSILTAGLGIVQSLTRLEYDAQLSYTNSQSRNPEDFIWNFSRDGSAFTVGRDDLFGVPAVEAFNTYVRADSTAPLATIWVDSRSLDEDQYAAELNLQTPFRLGDAVTGFVKTGGKLRWLDRAYDIERNGRQGLQYPGLWNQAAFSNCLRDALGPDWEARLELADSLAYLPINQVDLEREQGEDFFDGDFGLGYVPNEEELLELTRALQTEDCSNNYVSNSITSLGQDYSGSERYQAGYVMAEVDLGRFVTLIPGIRYERDYSEYTGQRFREIINAFRDAPPAELEELNIERENVYWLPMLHADIRPFEWMSIRLARTETISRPSYIQYAPITSINSFGSFIQAANTQLQPSSAVNYDASVQVVSGRLGLVGVSGFHKTVEDLILQVQYPTNPAIGAPEGTNVPEAWLSSSPQLQTYINNDEPATFYGIELEWQSNFYYLPGALKGLVLNVNYTRTFSETEYSSYRIEREFIPGSRPPQYTYTLVDTTREGRMPDQSAHIANVTLGWDYRGFSARVSYLFQSNTASYINPRQPLLDTFVGDYSRIDVSVRQEVIDGLEILANLNNLNNRPDRIFTGQDTRAPGYEFTETYPSFRELYGYTVDLGVRYRF